MILLIFWHLHFVALAAVGVKLLLPLDTYLITNLFIFAIASSVRSRLAPHDTRRFLASC